MAEVIYEKPFCSEGVEARALIVDYSDGRHVEFRLGVTERVQGAGVKDAVTFQDKFEEECAGVPEPVRRALWRDLFGKAKREVEREIRVATDPNYDLPDREIY